MSDVLTQPVVTQMLYSHQEELRNCLGGMNHDFELASRMTDILKEMHENVTIDHHGAVSASGIIKFLEDHKTDFTKHPHYGSGFYGVLSDCYRYLVMVGKTGIVAAHEKTSVDDAVPRQVALEVPLPDDEPRNDSPCVIPEDPGVDSSPDDGRDSSEVSNSTYFSYSPFVNHQL